MRIVLDESKCFVLGMCEAEAPDLFEVQDDGTLLVLVERPADGQREAASSACDACPTGALAVVEDDQ